MIVDVYCNACAFLSSTELLGCGIWRCNWARVAHPNDGIFGVTLGEVGLHALHYYCLRRAMPYESPKVACLVKDSRRPSVCGDSVHEDTIPSRFFLDGETSGE